MRSVTTNRVFIALAALATLGVPRIAFAEDSAAGASPTASPNPASDKVPPHLPVAFIEQLPGSAYPEPKVRGLRNGSLWLNMQGYQWPYMPKTGIGLSGYAWVDTSYESIVPVEQQGNQPAPAGSIGSKLFLQQARVLGRITPTWSDGDNFVQGQAELVATQLASQSSGILWSADDAWVRFGKWNLFDVQLGRFEMWEVYHFGMGMDLFTFERTGAQGLGPNSQLIPDPYAETSIGPIFLRQNSVGEGAVHLYPFDWLRFELGGQYGPETNGTNTWGLRPVAIVDLGWLKLKGEIQHREQKGQGDQSHLQQKQTAGGGAAQIVIDPYVEFGVNYEYAQQDSVKDTPTSDPDAAGTRHQSTIGGFANARPIQSIPGLLIGGGVHYTFNEDSNFDKMANRNDNAAHTQVFGAAQYLLFNQLYIKLVVAWAQAVVNPTPTLGNVYKSEVLSGRLRLEYFY